MTKFTDEELSRVLTAHELGGLIRGGRFGIAYPACIAQAAAIAVSFSRPEWDLMWTERGADWFDGNYQPFWTIDEFLAQLESQGLA